MHFQSQVTDDSTKDTSESDTVLTIAQRLDEVNLNGYVKLLDYSYFLDGIENMYQEYLIAKFKIQKEDIENIEDKLKLDISEVCKELPIYKHISDIEIREKEFEKTTTNKIKR